MIVKKKIDEKHHIEVQINVRGIEELGVTLHEEDVVLGIVKTGNNHPVPDDEPVILFRGRDRLAMPMLEHYIELCKADGCNDWQLAQMELIHNRFKAFAATSPTMKQPGVTKGA